MTDATDAHSLEEVLDRVVKAGGEESICLSDVVDAMGQRSFGPLLLVPSLAVVSPLSGVPGVSSLTGIIIVLIAGQMLIGRRVIWLPQRLQRRCISRGQIEKAVDFIGPAARFADRLVGRRLPRLTRRPFNLVIAAICVLAGLSMPPLEMTPFASSILGAAVAVFALALVAEDGVLAILALTVTIAGAAFGITALL